MANEKVDLFTYSCLLEELMISEYPGKITDEQYHIDDTLSPKTYCFYDLEEDVLMAFLESENRQIRDEHYQVRDKIGNIILENRAGIGLRGNPVYN